MATKEEIIEPREIWLGESGIVLEAIGEHPDIPPRASDGEVFTKYREVTEDE